MKLEINTGLLTRFTLNSCSVSTREPLMWLDNHSVFPQSTHSLDFLGDNSVPLFFSSNIKPSLFSFSVYWGNRGNWMRSSRSSHTHTFYLPAPCQVRLPSFLLLHEHPFCQERPIPALCIWSCLFQSLTKFLYPQAATPTYWVFLISI